LNIRRDVVDSIIVNYYNYVRANMSAVEHTHINLPGLGTFIIKPGSLKRKIQSLIKYIEKLKHPSTIQTYERIQEHVKRVELLEATKVKIDESYSKRHLKRQMRYEFIESNKSE